MMRALVLPVNAAFFAVPMEGVLQVLHRPPVTPLPLSPRGLLGVINVRGEIVPLYDTGVLTGTGVLNSPPFAVLVSGDKELVAMAAAELPTAADFEEPVAPSTRPGELGVYSSGGRLVVLLGVEELVSNHLDSPRQT